MSTPRTYADWVLCFDRLRAGEEEEEILARMEQGSIEWTAGIAEKMTQRLFEVLESRLKRATQQMNTEFSRVQQPDIDLVRALMQARRQFGFLKRMVNIPVFPEEVRNTLGDVLHNYVKDTQASLENSAKNDRSGRLQVLIKNNSLLAYDSSLPKPSVEENRPAKPDGISGITPKRRKVIF